MFCANNKVVHVDGKIDCHTKMWYMNHVETVSANNK